MLTLYALWGLGLIPVTVYASLGAEGLRCAIEETNARGLLCERSKKNILSPWPLTIRAVLCLGGGSDFKTEGSPSKNGILCPWEDVVKRGATPPLGQDLQPQGESLALIMYTSGTMGEPKGVMLSHANLVFTVRCLSRRLGWLFQAPKPQVYLAYLPLAHILELMAENVVLCWGCRLAYGSPRSLSSQRAKPRGDLETFAPHLLVAVPRVLETLEKALRRATGFPLSTWSTQEPRIQEGGWRAALLARALQDRQAALYPKGKETPLWRFLLRPLVRRLLGPRVRLILCGGSSLEPTLQRNLALLLGCWIVQGYGLTESSALAVVEDPGGSPLCTGRVAGEEVEIRLEPLTREVLLRGPHVMMGYFQRPELTAESFRPGRWFATGDEGEWVDAAGTMLQIRGRRKTLAKNAWGEYVALEALEGFYRAHPLFSPGGLCLWMGPRGRLQGVGSTEEARMRETWGESYAVEDPLFTRRATQSLARWAQARGKGQGLWIEALIWWGEAFTVENGGLTPSLKVNRRGLEARYKGKIGPLEV